MVAGTAGGVPKICVFYGIDITMYYDDHPPPHFHAKYGEYQAQVAIATGEVSMAIFPDAPGYSSKSGPSCAAPN